MRLGRVLAWIMTTRMRFALSIPIWKLLTGQGLVFSAFASPGNKEYALLTVDTNEEQNHVYVNNASQMNAKPDSIRDRKYSPYECVHRDRSNCISDRSWPSVAMRSTSIFWILSHNNSIFITIINNERAPMYFIISATLWIFPTVIEPVVLTIGMGPPHFVKVL